MLFPTPRKGFAVVIRGDANTVQCIGKGAKDSNQKRLEFISEKSVQKTLLQQGAQYWRLDNTKSKGPREEMYANE